MSVRAKFRCLEVTTRYAHTTDAGLPTEQIHAHFRVKLAPVYANSRGDVCAENRDFYAATPSGELVMECVHATAAAYFRPGRCYYIDFTEAAE